MSKPTNAASKRSRRKMQIKRRKEALKVIKTKTKTKAPAKAKKKA